MQAMREDLDDDALEGSQGFSHYDLKPCDGRRKTKRGGLGEISPPDARKRKGSSEEGLI